jgi:hypothetical protein
MCVKRVSRNCFSNQLINYCCNQQVTVSANNRNCKRKKCTHANKEKKFSKAQNTFTVLYCFCKKKYLAMSLRTKEKWCISISSRENWWNRSQCDMRLVGSTTHCIYQYIYIYTNMHILIHIMCICVYVYVHILMHNTRHA